jgi:diguanylate cyclase (GGDEF)-like protein/PAS domain S-box-containing protein
MADVIGFTLVAVALMPDDTALESSSFTASVKRSTALVAVFALVLIGCVFGLTYWKSVVTRDMALARSEVDQRNLTHSLTQHAVHTFQSAEVAMNGMVDSLKYHDPIPDRFNHYLADTVTSLPQLREIGVLDARGNWRYSSLAQTPSYTNADRDYFIYHRDHSDTVVRISGPLQSRLTGRGTILLTKRISTLDGRFAGVLVASIDESYWADSYKGFDLGQNGGVALMRADGVVLAHWPTSDIGPDLLQSRLFQTQSQLFQIRLQASPTGFYRLVSPFDGRPKYVAYEQASEYPIVMSVGQSEDVVLGAWRSDLRSDLYVTLTLLGVVIAMAVLLTLQFESRLKVQRALNERERRYHLLADNIADIVVLLDRNGNMLLVSQSMHSILGRTPDELIGKSCFELIHPADVAQVRGSKHLLSRTDMSRTVEFRAYHADGTELWMEANFKIAERVHDGPLEIVSVLREISERKKMEAELTSLNARLGQLASTDSLTGLANRRLFDEFFRQQYEASDEISVILLDIDHFKNYNDRFGHQAGDECLKLVAKVLAEATDGTKGMSARYGGEEFVIVLPGLSIHMAFIVAEAVRFKVASMEIENPGSGLRYISISAGIACKSDATENETDLLGYADQALYQAKNSGRNTSIRSLPRENPLRRSKAPRPDAQSA